MSLRRVGRTEHFVSAYEARLGGRGEDWAARLLARCEADYARLQYWFGVGDLPGVPFICHVVPGNYGAWHNGCDSTRIYLSAGRSTDPFTLQWALVAEVVEVFSAAQGRGWDCGSSNGEGLSRVLATDRYPRQLDGYASASYWLNSTRRNFVDHTDPSDTRWVSIGCAVLFLNYLRHHLGYSWRAIVAHGQSTLGETHAALTGRNSGWRDFSALVERHFPGGHHHTLDDDNIFRQ